MFKRYYDPEIFVQTLDGIDRSNHIVATYFMDDELPGEDFVATSSSFFITSRSAASTFS